MNRGRDYYVHLSKLMLTLVLAQEALDVYCACCHLCALLASA